MDRYVCWGNAVWYDVKEHHVDIEEEKRTDSTSNGLKWNFVKSSRTAVEKEDATSNMVNAQY